MGGCGSGTEEVQARTKLKKPNLECLCSPIFPVLARIQSKKQTILKMKKVDSLHVRNLPSFHGISDGGVSHELVRAFMMRNSRVQFYQLLDTSAIVNIVP